MTCLFCGSSRLKLLFEKKFHPEAGWHGPFDLYSCLDCHSAVTIPLPSADQLSKLYSSFNGGMMPHIRALRDEYPLNAWFNQCIDHAIGANGNKFGKTEVFNWIDLGAGNGELSKMMMQRFPLSTGVAADFHDKPEGLTGNGIKWLKADLNDHQGSPISFLTKADFVFLITVLEHLMRPDIFIGHALHLLKPGGCFYLTVPRTDCLAFSLLKGKWPYLIMGEHLNIPSVKGMKILLSTICDKMFGLGNAIVTVKPVILPYPLGYYLQYFGLKKLADIIPHDVVVRIPTGLLEASVVVKEQPDQH
jgi:SAM-dependent methyltransferase